MKITHPYTGLEGGHWLRGNLHAHTTRSDGRRPAQEVIDDYAGRGYDFLMLSDHDICTSAEECAAFNDRGMVLIPGNEVSANGPHLLHVNAASRVEPDADRQKVLNAIARQPGSFAVMNHPNWKENFDHCPIDQLTTWTGYAGLEIYNGTIGRLNGSPYATNKWDMLLSQGRRVWGFAHDDSHLPAEDIELGWNMVCVQERTAGAIADALNQGRFYASTGVTITDITVTGRRIRVETRDAKRVVALMQVGRRIAHADGPALEIDVPDNARYVRFECWGDGERFAWTQPFFIAEQG